MYSSYSVFFNSCSGMISIYLNYFVAFRLFSILMVFYLFFSHRFRWFLLSKIFFIIKKVTPIFSIGWNLMKKSCDFHFYFLRDFFLEPIIIIYISLVPQIVIVPQIVPLKMYYLFLLLKFVSNWSIYGTVLSDFWDLRYRKMLFLVNTLLARYAFLDC